MFVEESGKQEYEDLGYTAIQFNDTTYLMYSKTVGSLPPTTIVVEYQPCMNPTEMSISPDQQFYKTELL